jgi:hypothetical protein
MATYSLLDKVFIVWDMMLIRMPLTLAYDEPETGYALVLKTPVVGKATKGKPKALCREWVEFLSALIPDPAGSPNENVRDDNVVGEASTEL